MRWPHFEYVCKGLFLGLLVFVAFHEPSWTAFGQVAGCLIAGFLGAVGIAYFQKVREGYRPGTQRFSFLLFILLESGQLIYAGVLLGIVAGAALRIFAGATGMMLPSTVAGGVALGLIFPLLRQVGNRPARLGLSLVMAAVLALGAMLLLGMIAELGQPSEAVNLIDHAIFGTQLLLGVPLFYLLLFVGYEEETEVEAGALCAVLALGSVMVAPRGTGQAAWLLVPFLIYIWYSTRVLPRLRIFKHTIRGINYTQANRHRQAILSFRRALQLDPQNAMAREGLWAVHRALDMNQLAEDKQTLELVDFDLCLERAGSLLMGPPSPEKLQEARRLLDLVLTQKIESRAPVYYWRAVAHTHERRYDEAAADLQHVLDPAGYSADDGPRSSVLLPAWQLALRSRP